MNVNNLSTLQAYDHSVHVYRSVIVTMAVDTVTRNNESSDRHAPQRACLSVIVTMAVDTVTGNNESSERHGATSYVAAMGIMQCRRCVQSNYKKRK